MHLARSADRIRELLRKEIAPLSQGIDDAFDRTRDEFQHLLGLGVDLDKERRAVERAFAHATELRLLREVCNMVSLTGPETNLLIVSHVVRTMGLQGANASGQIVPKLLEILRSMPESKEGF